MRLAGVDTDSILQAAASYDNQGNRIRLVKDLLFEDLKIEENALGKHYTWLWRGGQRHCTIELENIRTLSAEKLQPLGDDWKLVIDYPFDEAGHGPRDDRSQLDSFREQHRETLPQGCNTLCWIPAFLNDAALRDLAKLLVIGHVLAGDNLDRHASHLSLQDRQSAKQILENQRSTLCQQVGESLEIAYGLRGDGAPYK